MKKIFLLLVLFFIIGFCVSAELFRPYFGVETSYFPYMHKSVTSWADENYIHNHIKLKNIFRVDLMLGFTIKDFFFYDAATYTDMTKKETGIYFSPLFQLYSHSFYFVFNDNRFKKLKGTTITTGLDINCGHTVDPWGCTKSILDQAYLKIYIKYTNK